MPDPRSGSESEADAVERIEIGQSVQASFDRTDAASSFATFDVYRFRGEPGTQVTVTVRSGGPQTFVGLAHQERLTIKNTYFAADSQPRGQDNNGPHSEAVATLPPDDDGEYFIWVSAIPGGALGPYSLSLVSGAAPAADIVQAHGAAPATKAAAVAGSTPAPRAPNSVAANVPEPIYGNTGKYMCPFTEDGTVAPWVEKGMSASVGANVGSAVGAYAGQKALEQVPFFGGFLGGMVGKATGREIAIRGAGGWEFIKQSSDLSFNSLDDMARYLHATNASHPQYIKVLQATYGIYPELQQSMAAVSRR